MLLLISAYFTNVLNMLSVIISASLWYTFHDNGIFSEEFPSAQIHQET